MKCVCVSEAFVFLNESYGIASKSKQYNTHLSKA